MRKLVQINVVTVTLILALLAVGYGAWKFVPPWWQSRQVDQILAKAKFEAARINMVSGDSRAQDLTNRIRDQIIDLGIDDRYLDVYFSDDFLSIHADYRVWVHHPAGEPTELEFERSLDIPQADLAD